MRDTTVSVPSSTLHRRWTRAVDCAIGGLVEPVAAALVVVEVFILGAGVFSRYVLKDALVWTDEMAPIFFLWLTMLGAVSAYRRNEHMRLTTFIRRFPPQGVAVLDAVVNALVAFFSLELLTALLWPTLLPAHSGLIELLRLIGTPQFFASSYLGQELIDLTPALQIPRFYEVLGIVVGIILILVVAMLRLIDGRPKEVLLTLSATIALSIVAYLGRPVFSSLGNFNLVLFFVGFVGGWTKQ
ncbi:MAG: TRAP transporter small permease subunit, partial [Rhizobiales bacterium]|nr:TRAP transporter small permease subunit [Hyphomicrobiales bacterium]